MKKFQTISAIIGMTTLSAVAFAHGGHGHGHGKMDTNKDGKVTLAEAQLATKARFEHLDKNRNGVVTKDEIPERAEHYLMRNDANKDGQVTLAEAEAKTQTWFQKLDTNKDGAVTKEEFHQARHHDKDGAKDKS